MAPLLLLYGKQKNREEKKKKERKKKKKGRGGKREIRNWQREKGRQPLVPCLYPRSKFEGGGRGGKKKKKKKKRKKRKKKQKGKGGEEIQSYLPDTIPNEGKWHRQGVA